MTDANKPVDEILLSSIGIMSNTSHPPIPQTHRSAIAPRRASSAPDLRTHSSLESISTSFDRPVPSGYSASLRSSYSPRGWRSYETHQRHSPFTPLSPAHNRARSRGSTPEPQPPPAIDPTPAEEDELSQSMELMARRLEEIRRNLSRRQRRANRPSLQGFWIAARGFFGYGPEGMAARRDSVSLAAKLFFGTGQISATIALLCLGAREKSPVNDALNEWQACRRPLGVWCSIWCVRVVLGCLMAIWAHRRKAARLAETAERMAQTDPPNTNPPHILPSDTRITRPEEHRTDSDPHPQADPNNQVSDVKFSRIMSLLSLLSLTWFITAHVLIYTSVHTCRLSAPHLWWLTFGIICIGYLVVAEVILVAFLVFVLGPVIFIFLNTILICMGRPPLGHPGVNPEVGKLSHKTVDRIPLVLYIPAPKDISTNGELQPTLPSPPQDSPTPEVLIAETTQIHSYPPEPERVCSSPPSILGTRVQSRSRRLFTFRRIKLRKGHKANNKKGKEKQFGTSEEEHGNSYEDKWEKGDYPFVKLEDNRAACAICLCDFEEPRRIRYSLDSRPPVDLDQEEKGDDADPGHTQGEGKLKLTDPGEGAQPLRLLDCAHVFHKTCLDPWLTEVSGRCPVCQRPVVIEESKNERGRRPER